MPDNIEERKAIASNWFRELRDSICSEFEEIEKMKNSDAKFKKTTWDREGGGGGEMSIMNGQVFEKVGVNISTVFGEFSDNFAKEIPGTKNDKSFWASGISLVAHMHSPFIPAAHMNTRFIVTESSWFGGGGDITSTYINSEDVKLFHNYMKEACDNHDSSYYSKFKKNCDEYFFLPHRDEPRGQGGIFFDYLNTGKWEKDFSFTKNVGRNFKHAFNSIIKRNLNKSWTKEEKEKQLYKRGRYVEFNLLYDRGTKFGLMTNGNTDAILMSLPPEVKWK